MTAARRLPWLVAAALGAVACGPSFQILYECDVHFEHCYALDQGAVAPDAKKDCWRDWLHGYTYGQSRDRIEFAATRFSELSLDPTLPSEDVPGKRPHRRPDKPIAAPVPTNAFAPPPNVSDGHSGPEPSASAAAKPPREASLVHVTMPDRPGADCAETCGDKWNTCRGSCKDHSCETCDQAYRVCMPVCFHEEAAAAAHPAKGVH